MSATLSDYLHRLLSSRSGRRWALVDLTLGFCAMLAALHMSPYTDIYEVHNRVIVASVYGFTLVVCLRLSGLTTLRMEHLLSAYEVAISALQGILIAFLLVGFVVNFSHMHVFGRYVVLYTFGISFVGVVSMRLLCIWAFSRNPLKITILGSHRYLPDLIARLEENAHFKIHCIACTDDLSATPHCKRFDCRKIDDVYDFAASLEKEKVALVVSCYQKEIPTEIYGVMERLPFHGIDILNEGAFIEQYYREISVTYRNLHWQTGSYFNQARGASRTVKRIFDILGASCGLCLTLPFWPLIALAIRMETPGKAIFKQTRVGYLGRNFTLYKFRSMGVDAEKDGAQWAKAKDPRVTKLGACLRKTRIDELPQLWNVFKGDMSLIGPRPERPEFVKQLNQHIPLYEWRHLTRPGLSGWAQIRYKYGDSIEDAQRKLQFDLYYVKNLSFQLDLQIALQTLPLLMRSSR